MHQELENLVNNLISSGEITQRSRDLLMKKAEQLGVDAIDFELELEGRIARVKTKTSIPQTSIASSKDGALKKCPSCGAPSQAFATTCKDCGHEFREREASKTSTLLKQQLDELTSKETEAFNERVKNAKSFWEKSDIGCNPVMFQQNLLAKQESLIQQFPIPTTKEDILEFLTMSIPLSKKILPEKSFGFLPRPLGPVEQAQNRMSDVWLSKAKQVIMKARFSMKDDKKT